MKSLKLTAASLCMLATFAAPMTAQTIQTFEDFSPCDNTRPNVGVYGSVDYLLEWTCYGFAQDPFNPHSGTNRVYAVSGGGNASSASFAFAPTMFLGAWFAGSATVDFQLFFGGNLVGTSSSMLTSGTPTFLSSGYAGMVDKVTVAGSGIDWIMDDVTFGTAATTVPEPGALTLVLTGLATLGVGLKLRRRRVN